ncbi:cache domain-containing protein [bacterium]|nr:cache domain-containing protein [bacterium]
MIGGALVLITVGTGIVGVVGTFSIDGSVLREAQARVDHDLDMVASLYRQSFQVLAQRMQSKLSGFTWSGADTETAERLQQWKQELNFAVLNVCDPDGRPLAGAYPDRDMQVSMKADPVLRRALVGRPAWGTVLLEGERLESEGGLALRNRVAVRAAQPSTTTGADSALFQWFAAPVAGADGRVLAFVYGGRPLNHDYEMVDTLRDIVFGTALYEDKPLGTVTVFLAGTRVATNVLDAHGRRAVGTEVSEEVREEVLQQGQRWRARAWVVDAWYLSGYQPLHDPDGRTIGMLYVGLLEAPYSQLRTTLITRFLAPVSAVLVLGFVAAWWVVRRITRPLQRLRDGAERIAKGDWDTDIAEGRMYSEIADLARVFRQMQQAIKQRDQQLMEQNRALGETNEQLRETNSNYMKTLRFVTHELKSPLATIQAMIDLLVSDMLGEVPDKLRHPLIRIKQNCEELQDMVKNYLDLARAERAELVAIKTRINVLEDVVEPCVTQTHPLLDSRQVRMETDCRADLIVEADAELMRIALSNFLSNAAKYGREGGRAQLRAGMDEDGLTVCVWNEGPGFSEEEGKLLFGKFSRLRNDTTRGKRGSGLGLYLCKQILELHAGHVWAESEQGQWARFCFRLPRSACPTDDAQDSGNAS